MKSHRRSAISSLRLSTCTKRSAADGTSATATGTVRIKEIETGAKSQKRKQNKPSGSDASSNSPPELKRKDFEKRLAKLQAELVKVQSWVQHKRLKVVVIFEGRDAAGKGGVIKRITERVSPRIFRLVALPAPTEREKSQMHVQRYIPSTPASRRRSGHLRSQLVQSRRGRKSYGLLLSRRHNSIS